MRSFLSQSSMTKIFKRIFSSGKKVHLEAFKSDRYSWKMKLLNFGYQFKDHWMDISVISFDMSIILWFSLIMFYSFYTLLDVFPSSFSCLKIYPFFCFIFLPTWYKSILKTIHWTIILFCWVFILSLVLCRELSHLLTRIHRHRRLQHLYRFINGLF